MSNVNTVAGFPHGLPALATGGTTATAPALVSGGSVRAVAAVPADVANGEFDGRAFRVRATGYITTAGNYAHTLALYWNSGGNTDLTTTTNDVLLGTTGAVTINTATKSFILEAELIWDSTTKLITGDYKAIVQGVIQNSTPKALDAITANPSAAGGLQFYLLSTFGTGAAGNVLKVQDFSIERI